MKAWMVTIGGFGKYGGVIGFGTNALILAEDSMTAFMRADQLCSTIRDAAIAAGIRGAEVIQVTHLAAESDRLFMPDEEMPVWANEIIDKYRENQQ